MLASALDSVDAQIHKADEIIVVDDGSTDNTSTWVTQYYPHVKVIRQTNHGVAHARNRAISRAQGKWIAFLDSDDQWYPNKLHVQIEALVEQPQFRLCHCDEHWLRNGRRVNPMNKHRKQGGWIFEQCLALCVISPSATIIRRDLLDDIGQFDETLPACEDYDLWLRVCAQEPVLFLDQTLLQKTGGHADQLSRRFWGMDRFRLQSLAKLIRSEALTEQQHTLASAMFVRKYRVYTQGALKRKKVNEVAQLRDTYSDVLPDSET